MAPAAIARLPLLRDQFNEAWDSWAKLVGLEHSLMTSGDIKFADSAVLIAAAIEGQGVALARRLLVGDDLRLGRVVRLDTSSVLLDRGLYFVCRNGDQDRMPIRLLKDWLFSLFTKQSDAISDKSS